MGWCSRICWPSAGISSTRLAVLRSFLSRWSGRWSIFTTMLAEAEHAHAPEPILDAAWQWEDLLSKAFGPRF
jgi:hypothetical protein